MISFTSRFRCNQNQSSTTLRSQNRYFDRAGKHTILCFPVDLCTGFGSVENTAGKHDEPQKTHQIFSYCVFLVCKPAVEQGCNKLVHVHRLTWHFARYVCFASFIIDLINDRLRCLSVVFCNDNIF